MSLLGIFVLGLLAAEPAPAPSTQPAVAFSRRDRQHDFDFEIGNWATQVRIRRNPLSGQPPVWADYEGTSLVKPISGGRANFVELAVSGAAGRIEGVSLRLYNPQASQWSLNYAGFRDGMLTAPVYGGFDGSGRGAFYGHDMMEGRAIAVRFIVTRIGADKIRFEQAYSADGGVTWEDNWIAVDTRS
jgi:hypothetical protein